MNQLKKNMLTSEQAIDFIELMEQSYNHSPEEFDILFEFLYKECMADENVFFSLIALADHWNVLDKKYDTLYAFLHDKETFLKYLYYFYDKHSELGDIEFTIFCIIEQIKYWNKIHPTSTNIEPGIR